MLKAPDTDPFSPSHVVSVYGFVRIYANLCSRFGRPHYMLSFSVCKEKAGKRFYKLAKMFCSGSSSLSFVPCNRSMLENCIFLHCSVHTFILYKTCQKKKHKKSAVRMETRLQGGCKGTDVLIFRRSFCQINGHFVAPYGSSLSKFDFSCSNNSYSNHFLAYFILSDTIMNVLAKN